MQGVTLKIDKRPEETVDAYKVRLLKAAGTGRLDGMCKRFNREHEAGRRLYYDSTGGRLKR